MDQTQKWIVKLKKKKFSYHFTRHQNQIKVFLDKVLETEIEFVKSILGKS